MRRLVVDRLKVNDRFERVGIGQRQDRRMRRIEVGRFEQQIGLARGRRRGEAERGDEFIERADSTAFERME